LNRLFLIVSRAREIKKKIPKEKRKIQTTMIHQFFSSALSVCTLGSAFTFKSEKKSMSAHRQGDSSYGERRKGEGNYLKVCWIKCEKFLQTQHHHHGV